MVSFLSGLLTMVSDVRFNSLSKISSIISLCNASGSSSRTSSEKVTIIKLLVPLYISKSIDRNYFLTIMSTFIVVMPKLQKVLIKPYKIILLFQFLYI